MSRTTKVVGFSVPPDIAQAVEQVAQEERRTKSDLFREMFRLYQRYRKQRAWQEERWVEEAIQEAQQEQVAAPMTEESLLAESEHLMQYGAQQAKTLGIKPKNLNRLVHEYRAGKNP